MADISIKNQRDFFKNILLNDNGSLVISVVPKSLPLIKHGNQYKVYKNIILTQSGALKVTE